MRASSSRHGVIITGGSSGIGLALATALLQKPDNQYKVFVTGTRPLIETGLSNLSEAAALRYSSGDTGSESIVSQQFREAMDWFGDVPFTGLCINAGIGGGRYALEDFDVERFDRMFQTNVRGVFLWLKAALPQLKASVEPSQIVVTSSVMGSRPVAQAGPYCAQGEWSPARQVRPRLSCGCRDGLVG
jgi:NAD(P)-dependent dehydrogenase (short-subunit alcohol dehydrogenase family)